MDRWMALDIGDKRIGVAVSDPLGLTAQPVCRIDRIGWGPDVRRILALADEYDTRLLLVGMPRNMDGSYGAQAEKVRAFVPQLEKAGFAVTLWDERLSTVTAERALIEGGVRREGRRGVVDQIAAAVILQGFLDARQHREEQYDGT